jgi:hypothetical protein
MVVVLAWLLVCLAPAQMQWRHELLVSGLDEVPGGWPKPYGVNRNGDAYFYGSIPMPWSGGVPVFQVFKNGTNLNAKYFDMPTLGWTASGGINDQGQVAWSAMTPDGLLHMMVDGEDILPQVSPPVHDATGSVGSRGIDEQGRPLWLIASRERDEIQFFRGTEMLGGTLYKYQTALRGINRRGDAIWAMSQGEGVDLYVNSTNYSAPILGGKPRSADSWAYVNDRGDVLWTGVGPNTDGRMDVFLNDQNLTKGLLLDSVGALAQAFSNSGHFAWLAFYPGFRGQVLYVDYEDISSQVFGGRDHGIRQLDIYLTDDGTVAWIGAESIGGANRAVYRNRESISGPVLGGPPTRLSLGGMDRWGNVLWDGAGESTAGKEKVFVNTFCVSDSAFGEEPYVGAGAMTIGENGHVPLGSRNARWHRTRLPLHPGPGAGRDCGRCLRLAPPGLAASEVTVVPASRRSLQSPGRRDHTGLRQMERPEGGTLGAPQDLGAGG